MKHRTTLAVGVVALLGIGASAFGQATVIFSNIATSPTSDVPGMPGKKFNPGTTSSTDFDRPFVSPDGSRWIFGAIADDPVADLDVIIIGTGLTSAGSFLGVKEGDAAPGGAGVYSTLDTSMGINNAGNWAFGGDTTAATTTDDVVVRWTGGGGFELMGREGTPVPGMGGTIGFGSTNDATHILNNDETRFRSASLTTATTQQILYKCTSLAIGSVMAQTDVTIPAGQLVAPPQSIDSLSADRFRSDATGAHSIYWADLNPASSATDLVMVYDGNVVAQEGVVLPGSGFGSLVLNYSSDGGSQQISHNGTHYLFRGTNADTIDWVYGDGTVRAATDQPIFTGSTELFDDAPFAATFFLNVVNGNGDYVIGGTTNAADANKNAVLVLNGTTLIAREGDPVDVNGDGIFNDNAFLSVFNNDDAFLTDNLWYYFNANLRDANGTGIGQAFMRIQVPEPATLTLLGFAALPLLRRRTGR